MILKRKAHIIGLFLVGTETKNPRWGFFVEWDV
jgi:hypothetical protein